MPDAGLDAFRKEVREFLRQNLPADLAGDLIGGLRASSERFQRWQAILNSKGWGAPYWPKEHGGPGLSVMQRLVFDEECVAAGAPPLDAFAQNLLGPVLNTFGTAEQKAEHRPHILSGERQWCQGFSEPGSGSDLASLRTRAERDGDDYVVNGQKIWTSYAHLSDWIFLLVRTDAESKHAGISFLMVDMQTPGITVRPIVSIDDCHHLNEVFFDNVRVPVANRIGNEGDGWKLTKFLLNNEHAFTAELPRLKHYLKTLRKLAATQRADGSALIEQESFALKLARCEAELNALGILVSRVASLEGDHSPAAHALGSMLQVRGTELQQRMTELLVDALGDHGAIAYPEVDGGSGAEPLPGEEFARGLAAEMFFRRASTIYGGASEVQRGIIAKMLFQL